MKPNRDEPACLFAARAVLKRARPLLDEADGVRKGKDVECVHRMRVATRRLSSALALFEDCFPPKRERFWEKGLRRLRRALGKARDLDVQIAFVKTFLRESADFLGGLAETRYRPGIRLLLRRLEQRRAKRQKKVARAVNRFQKRDVLEDMTRTVKRVRSAARSQGAAADGIRVRAGDAIRSRLEALAALEPCVSQPENVEAHHAMRIAAKRLRYTLEVFRPLYGKPTARFIAAARDAQRMLGQIHDCDVWVEFLPQFLEKEERQAAAMAGGARPMRRLRPGLLFLQEDRRRQRERLFEGFSALWEKWRGDGLWEELRELLRARPLEERPRAVLSSPPAAA